MCNFYHHTMCTTLVTRYIPSESKAIKILAFTSCNNYKILQKQDTPLPNISIKIRGKLSSLDYYMDQHCNWVGLSSLSGSPFVWVE